MVRPSARADDPVPDADVGAILLLRDALDRRLLHGQRPDDEPGEEFDAPRHLCRLFLSDTHARRPDHGHLVGAAARHHPRWRDHGDGPRSEEHTSELKSLMRISYAVFCLKKKKTTD